MPVPPVVAIVVPAETAPDHLAAVLKACNLALGSGRCVSASPTTLASDSPTGMSPETASGVAWVGTVLPDPEQPTLVRVELGDAVERATRTRFSRTLTFDGTEAIAHRWSTAGVVVAALVISAESSNGAASGRGTGNAPTGDGGSASSGDPGGAGGTRAAPKPPGSATNSPHSAGSGSKRDDSKSGSEGSEAQDGPDYRVHARQFRLDLGGILGTGLQNGPLRAGFKLQPSLAWSSNVLVWSSLAATASSGTVQTFCWSGALGLGFAATDQRGFYGIEAKLGARGERIGFSTVSGTEKDQDFRLRWGGVGGVDLTLSLSKPLAIWVGAEAALMTPAVVVKRQGLEVGRLTSLDTSLQVGLRVRLGGAR